MTGLREIVMILDLHRQGAGVSAIARRTGLGRKTVRKVIAGGLEPPVYGPRPHAVVVQIEGSSYRLRQHADLLAQPRHPGHATMTEAPPRRRGRPSKAMAHATRAA
jgi:hypothetical protein